MIWYDSLREGFSTVNRNKNLIWIALISVVLGKSVNLVEKIAGNKVINIISEGINIDGVKKMISNAASGQYEEILQQLVTLEMFTPQKSMISVALVLIIAAFSLIGFLSEVGFTGVIRDLLVKKQYKVIHVISHGKVYFKRCFAFKFSLYFFAAGFALLIFPLCSFVYNHVPHIIYAVVICGIPLLPLIVVYAAFQSLGVRLIIFENMGRLSEIYASTFNLIKQNRKEVAILFLLMFIFSGLGGIVGYYLITTESFFNYPLIFLLSAYASAVL
jgi:hypothetical protein